MATYYKQEATATVYLTYNWSIYWKGSYVRCMTRHVRHTSMYKHSNDRVG